MNKAEFISRKVTGDILLYSIKLDSNPIFYFFLTVLIFHTVKLALPHQLIQATIIVSWLFIVFLLLLLAISTLIHFVLQEIEASLIKEGKIKFEDFQSPTYVRTYSKISLLPPAIYSLLLSFIDPMGGFCLISIYTAMLVKAQDISLSLKAIAPSYQKKIPNI